MKGKLAALIAGVILGSGGVALASGSITPWHHRAPSYYCYGYQSAAWCRLRGTPYNSFVRNNSIGLFEGDQVVFQCSRPYTGDPFNDCTDFR